MGMNSLGLWDLTVCIVKEMQNYLFLFLFFYFFSPISGDARLRIPVFIYGYFGDFYLYADIVPVLCFCTVRPYHAVLFLVRALESLQV